MSTVILFCYTVVGLLVGGLVWRDTAGTWRDGGLYPHVARCVLVSVCAAVCWPRTLIVAACCRPGDRPALARELLGQPGSDRHLPPGG